MGTKIVTGTQACGRFGKILTALALIFCGCQFAQAAIYTIPETTLQIANEAHVKAIVTKPKSEFVRVGIGDTAFKNYTYNEISLYGTGDLLVYEDGLLIGRVSDNRPLKIRLEGGQLLVYTSEHNLPSQVKTKIRIECPEGLIGVYGLKRAGSSALYKGEMEIVRANGGFNLVNVLEVEEYLKGVVPNEMPVRFGLEALKAQSVAARNYVLSPRTKASPNYDVVDSVASQVYYGANTEKSLSNEAVKETEGIVAICNWELILAQYSSTAGGYTESFANVFSDPVTKQFPSVHKPYLVAKPDVLSQTPLNTDEAAAEFYKSKPDSYDVRSPYFRWDREWAANELKSELETSLPAQSATGFVKPAFTKGQKLGNIKELRVNKRGESGKIIELEIVTDAQNYKVFKELVIRRAFTKSGKALPSANMVFEHEQDTNGNLVKIKAYGGGYGHGVGMSQYGAGFMGEELHFSFDKILKHYYTGITLATKPIILSANEEQTEITQHFYSKRKYAKIIVDNKYLCNKFIVNINGKEYIFELPVKKFANSRIAEVDISNYIKSGRNTVTFRYPEDEDTKKALRMYVEIVKADESGFDSFIPGSARKN